MKIELLNTKQGGIPKVYITLDAYERMFAAVDNCTLEVGWLGEVEHDREKGIYLITSIHIPMQEVMATETDIDAQAIGNLAASLEQPENLRFWGHSHVNMGVSPSMQDICQAKEFGENGTPWMICGVFNRNRDCRIDFYDFERGLAYKELPLHFCSPNLDKIVDEVREIIKANVKQRRWDYGSYTYKRDNKSSRKGNSNSSGRGRGNRKPSGYAAGPTWDDEPALLGYGYGSYAQSDESDVYDLTGWSDQDSVLEAGD